MSDGDDWFDFGVSGGVTLPKPFPAVLPVFFLAYNKVFGVLFVILLPSIVKDDDDLERTVKASLMLNAKDSVSVNRNSFIVYARIGMRLLCFVCQS